MRNRFLKIMIPYVLFVVYVYCTKQTYHEKLKDTQNQPSVIFPKLTHIGNREDEIAS